MLMYLSRNTWILFVALAGLSWGTYVPLIAYGGAELGGKAEARLLAILCVGIAYFLIAVLYPVLYLVRLPKAAQPEFTRTGLIFSGLAGAAGAIGAICVVFATAIAPEYKMFIAPLIFGLAPVINTLVSMIWHPKKGQPLHFGYHPPHWLLWVGIVCVGVGAALVLYSKELGETSSATAPTLSAAVTEGFTSKPWILFAVLAGLSWGTYVPLIFYGGGELGGKPSSRLLAILCVGLAYFFMAVLAPGVMLWRAEQQPNWTSATGLSFSGLAGAAGAIGAICVIFATKSAVESAKAEGRPPATYKLFIAPLIFGLAPVINTLVSVLWHPEPGNPAVWAIKAPHPLLWVGIVFVGLGAALVLYSKELSEAAPGGKPATEANPKPNPA
jgi:drug/metabolite transporter (DMT)-like permease